MSEIPQIVLPHGGYRKLTAFQKSEVVYQMTVVFLSPLFAGTWRPHR